MARAKRDPGTLVRFVTRAISDRLRTDSGCGIRPIPPYARMIAEAAVGAFKRGKKRGCR